MTAEVLDQFVDQLASAVAEKLGTKQQVENNQKATFVNEYMNKSQLASYLGTSRSTIDRWIKQRDFPNTKIGGKYTFKKSEVDEWITKHSKN